MKELTEEELEKLKKSDYNLDEEREELKGQLVDAYRNIVDLLKKYCDLEEKYYPLIACWIIGTYFHNQFESYPYLFLNAMRSSGKSRTLKLITRLSKEGEMQMSMTEAVLFRTSGTLGIDEFEGLSRRGNENLRELLNASYKKGTKVKRMRQKNTMDGVKQIVEEFDVYRPIVMANIWGMEEVLGDRCISIILERSQNNIITRLVEIYEHEEIFKKTKEILKKCSLCSVVVTGNLYIWWNDYILHNNTYTNTTYNNTNYTQLFDRLNSIEIDGRNLELMFPLLLVAWEVGEDVFEELFETVGDYIKEKREDQFAESRDISLIDYVSQEPDVNWISIKEITKRFKEFLQSEDDWINEKWIGRALKRLKLRKAYKRESGGMKVVLDITKAQDKIRMFK